MYGAIATNKRNTILIMAVFVGIVSGIGYLVSLYFGDTSITLWVLVAAFLYALFQYFAASKLAVAMNGAREIEKKDNPRLYRIVENLAITTGMPTPKIYLIDDPAPNAFATGRNPQHAIVGATTGLLEIMNDREVTAVMAHEMGHVQNYDIRVSMISFGLVSAIGLLSDIVLRMLFFGGDRRDNVHPAVYIVGIIVIILAPIIAAMVQMAVSRQREYLADASGALTTRDSEGMASALEKLLQFGKPMQHQNSASANLFLSNPLKPSFLSKLFSSHPPLEDRIARLRDNANKF
ncbi:TPA: protease [Candidatus Saccharibacteria bacterium]|nr:MAG: membrane protease [Candidatus Saccharibacteria bacterium GW2011_GWC2_44_17]MBH1956078.1 M48 family metalloprotease [Candidatus Saccharibacteria bacterium]OGL23610.1 MAG: protease [Candidatus Saccharibacteria bacterium RIFCSPHIGHO2_01_FULL_46_30]OGL33372.1 MAG: protease [Candidatus Saccharibacteria bacterium RIFCSPHIGHO2_12_FULL_47_16]MBH1972466.1 M48 family metalloprotease [Candidatus Saccharibacteria bacterium]